MNKYAGMGKNELRAACKAAGISYSKLNNDGMRDALCAHEATQVLTETRQEKSARIEMTEYTADQLDSMPMAGVEPDEAGLGHCPHCGSHLGNGVATYADICETDKHSAGKMERHFYCMACDGEWGPMIVRTKSEDRHSGTNLKIEKNRETCNGVTRPSAGGKCREVWDYLDEVYDNGNGPMPTAKMVKEAAAELEWNPNNASIEFYQWRKFHGIKGRR